MYFIFLVYHSFLLMLNLIAGPHLITGNGVGFKPDILDMDVMDKVLEVMVITNLKAFSIQL
jgi:hypothetical protein